ncbi:YqaA family protein [Desulfobulbus alkaliphilus]|uniref:YqaA family protein n=1 Tax=Desulfobulbus alkaliphilus TaxID=869814 RepID=UPI0019630170|nr:VTT domain-containing protein [Desulfobulbus alkaliphilus]MBM9538392.1 DedA family protein [Desulfobulbus alkaliphilus]
MAGPSESPTGPAARRRSALHRLYDWCMKWIQTPAGIWTLFLIAVAESSFFPIPPDVFLIALCVAAPHLSFRFAAICAVGSVIGGMIGYGIGLGFMDTIGQRIMEWYSLHDKYAVVQDLYQRYDAWAVGAAGFTPLPYKLFTITAGAFKVDFFTFVLMSLLSRSARFFLVAALIYKFGARVQYFINRYFNILTIVFFILLIGGFVAVRLLL